jgi:tetratricopeptide (TPR) repeat protein
MTGFILRIFIALALLGGTVGLFLTGFWGWGITSVFPLAIVIFSFFRNEQVILALNQMRLGNQEKAKKHINRITAPQYMTRRQHAYVLYLKALMNAQELGFAQSEQLLRKALSLGLRTSEDNAVARMHLAGICAQTGRRPEASALLTEAKKYDKSGMLKDQIKMLQSQMQAVPSKNQMRMAQMMGGRKKMPKMR